ncbi:MAG: type IV pilus biogenesis/stability protein PilW [Colwellia sp.]|nr:type IV pilus biogenesis/stability protein PilW [Colwellia sp.]
MPRFFITNVIVLLTVLSGCVTQSFENDSDIPVVESESSKNDMAMTRITLGLGYLNMGNTTQAKLNLEKARRFSPNLSEVYTAFAHYYDVVGESKLATNSYEKALSIDPNNPDTLNNYGVFLCRNEKYEAAEKYTLKAIEIPAYLMVSQSYENLALCQLKTENFAKAEKYFKKSIQHSPNRASVLLQMVRLQYALADYKTAQKYLQRYEKATRRFSPEALALAYKVFEKQRNRRIAKNYAGMLLKMFPNSYEAKQYIINELEHIEADDLAKVYQGSHLDTLPSSPTKRVVVLSPKNPRKILYVATDEKESLAERSVVKTVAVESNQSKFKQAIDRQIHLVQSGDSLFSISTQYNIHMYRLESWNNIFRDNVLSLGQKLYVSSPQQINTLTTNRTTKNNVQEKTQ